ncbi:hypothetical protein BDW74DRAFT_179892 [Aspergillus multicolor]|uniref:uncharacterized protein n=1 Tax=Aspergillus multicolor TaxID=41759 RepID=UPI003CCD5AB9
MAIFAELPTELLDIIFGDPQVCREDTCNLYRVCRRSRQLCAPVFFQHVNFTFSEHGLRHLRAFTESGSCHYAVQLTYRIPFLLNLEALHLAGDSLARLVTFHDGIFRSTKNIRKMLRNDYNRTQEIIHSERDFDVLFSALKNLPSLSILRFELHNKVWGQRGYIYKEDSAGRRFDSFQFENISEIEGESTRPTPRDSYKALQVALRRMFTHTDTVKIIRSNMVLQLCAWYPLHICNLDIQDVTIDLDLLRMFLCRNLVATLRRIGVQNLQVTDGSVEVVEVDLRYMLDLLNISLWNLSSGNWRVGTEGAV